jgi:hypothetical protein
MNDDRNGPIDDPASWATNLDDPAAVRELVRAAVVQTGLCGALAAVGHSAAGVSEPRG